MIRFTLNDVTFEALKSLAGRLGIPNAATIQNKEEVIRKLQQWMAPGGDTVLAPLEAGKPGWQSWMKVNWIPVVGTLIAVGSLVTAYFSMQATLVSARTAADNLRNVIEREQQQKRDDKVATWQQVIVYKVIEEGTKSGDRSIPFESIRQRYMTEAASAAAVDLKKDELNPLVLRKILQDLMALQLVYQTLDDNYVIQRSATNPRVDRVFLEDNAKYAILNLLSREGGKYAIHDLSQIITDQFKITNEEFHSLVNQLMAANMVLVGDDKKLWSLISIPRRKP
jgi:hypothetical protein